MRVLTILLVVLVALGSATAQNLQPVDLNVPNIMQETPVWCWAAVSEQIIRFSQGGNAPRQCELVAMANGVSPYACCSSPTPCMVAGSIQQIQGLILACGGRYSSVAPPANPIVLYNTLAQGHPIILQLQPGPRMGHVIVLRGMDLSNPMGPVLYVNDPMAYYTQPILFSNLVGIWSSAIVVY